MGINGVSFVQGRGSGVNFAVSVDTLMKLVISLMSDVSNLLTRSTSADHGPLCFMMPDFIH